MEEEEEGRKLRLITESQFNFGHLLSSALETPRLVLGGRQPIGKRLYGQ